MFSFRSDPTENDSVEGLRPNARGPGLVTFGVSVSLFPEFSLLGLQRPVSQFSVFRGENGFL